VFGETPALPETGRGALANHTRELMRPRIVIAALIVGAAIIAGIIFFGVGNRPPAEDSIAGQKSGPTESSAPTAAVAAGGLREASRPVASSNLVALTAKPPLSAEERQAQEEVVDERIDELNQLAASNDPNDLRQILTELNNPEPKIRAAAVQATVQFESPDAIPALKEALAQTTDLDEAVALRNAIHFLSLSNIAGKGANRNP
jgi:hypothetical protein